MAPPRSVHVEIGAKFGRWTVLSESRVFGGGRFRWLYHCRCECGSEGDVRPGNLLQGKSLSCGCLQHEMLSTIAYRHGEHGTPLYKVWASLKARCLVPTHHAYANYGGRGIGVHAEWVSSFVAFRDWAVRNGYARGLTLDRADNDGDYTPENCRWVTQKENNRNRRVTVVVEAFGERKTIDDWLARSPVTRSSIARRLKRGWSAEKAITTPARAAG